MAPPLFEPKLVGQARVVDQIRRLVDAWRGFPLGPAQDPYPDEPARYQPTLDDERSISPTTRLLLRHWFRHEPHPLKPRGFFKYWPHQRRLVESFIYLHEVRGIRRTEQLYALAGAESLGPQRDPWAKLGGQLATGSGKTKMMSLLIAWSFLNAACEGEAHLGLGRHSVLIAPGLFVRDRLLSDFLPPDGRPAIFFGDPVIPPELRSRWDLTVYDPETCPRRLDPERGALIVTNFHQLLRIADELLPLPLSAEQEQMDLIFSGAEPQRLEVVGSPLIERFAHSRGLLVLNDEAHHVWDETGHVRFEQQAKERGKLGEDEAEAMAWIRSIQRLNGDAAHGGRVGLQVDLSATLYEETGASGKKAGKADFRPTNLFRHTVVDYPLAEAIRDNIVKKPVLERLVARKTDTGEIAESVLPGMPNAWETYRYLVTAGIKRWQEVQKQFQAEGSQRKPILFILCAKKEEAQEIANYLTYGQAVRDKDTAALPVTGFHHPDQPDAPPLFVYKNPDGEQLSTVIQIHIGKQEEANEDAWDKIRQSVNLIDHDRVRDPSGVPGADGLPRLIDNPYNVVISVMMLKEGWDVRNVKVIVPLRPSGSRTLTEQTLGRGLRKIHPPEIDEEGAVEPIAEELYVIEHPSFRTIIDQLGDIMEVRDSGDIKHTREYVAVPKKAVLEERRAGSVRLVRFLGLVEDVPDWRKRFDLNTVPDLTQKLPWRDEVSRVQIQTYLKEALQERETEGQHFELPDVPSYLELEMLLEQVYVNGLIKGLQTTGAHRPAIKGVVREFLEKKTFKLPRGVALSFDRMLGGEDALIVIGNLTREDVRKAVHAALLPALKEALKVQVPRTQPRLREERAEDLPDYQALRRNVVDKLQRSVFERAATGNNAEERTARLLDQAHDVVGWLYNHRSGVGYFIEYEWQGGTSRYFPDFIARAKIGELVHNFVIEVKGRFDDKDKQKAQEAQRHCELLNEHDREPWHYLLLLESPSHRRSDIGWWERQSPPELGHLWRHLDAMPLFPGVDSLLNHRPVVVAWVPYDDRYRSAFPVYDLAAAASAFSDFQQPVEQGWMRFSTGRRASREMFIAKVVGDSMEPAIPSGSWALFRKFPAAPSAVAMDGRRVVVQLREQHDPELGGSYTLKRWRIARVGADGIEAIDLVPENRSFQVMHFTGGDLRVVAEFLEVVGPSEAGAADGELITAAQRVIDPPDASSAGAESRSGNKTKRSRPVLTWIALLRQENAAVQEGSRRERLEARSDGFAAGLISRLRRRYQVIDGGSSLDRGVAAATPGAQQVYVRRLPGLGALMCSSGEPIAELLRGDEEVQGVLCGDDEIGQITELAGESSAADEGWQLDAVGAGRAYRRKLSGAGVWVGIADTGIDDTHSEFADRKVLYCEMDGSGYPRETDGLGQPIQVLPTDSVGHGTHVAGIIAGRNTGVAPGASLAIVKITDTRKICISPAFYGLEWLLTVERPDGELGVDIINLSWGFSEFEPRFKEVIARIRTLKIEVFAAMGNSGPGKHSSPANYASVLGVGAVDEAGLYWPDSGRGVVPEEGDITKPDLVAPGVGIRSCLPNEKYGFMSSTSAAAPVAVGVAALIQEERGPDVDLRAELRRRAQVLSIDGQPAYRVRF